MLPVAPASSGPVCHQVQQQLHLCLTSSRSTSPGSRGPQSTLGGSGPTCLPTSSFLGQVVEKLQDHPCNRLLLVQHALVLGPGDHVKSDPTVSALSAWPLAQLFNQTLHRNLVNLSLHAWPLEPQLPRKQGFPEAVAARIEAPQEDQQISI